MQLDKETAEQMRRGDILRHLVEGEGWALAKEILHDQMKVLDSVSTIPNNMSLEDIGKEAMFRAYAISLVQQWLDAIEGRVEQHKDQSTALAELHTEEVIRTYSSSS
jgi:hypothetical protein